MNFAHQLFEEHAVRAPQRLAVVCLDQQLSYGELNARANQVAHRLRSLGVGPNTLVAISAERSLEMVIGILGVLKAGGAYVPLDPTYPKDRLAFMLADARPSVLLTQAHLAAKLPGCEAQTVLLHQMEDEARNSSDRNPKAPQSSEDLAYVIYTSGSTGKPKGVMIAQGNLGHSVRSLRNAVGLTRSDVYLHTASISFSSSVRQLMLPLSVGASVVVATADEIRDAIALFKIIKRLGVTIIDIVPSHWRSCIDALASLSAAARSDLLDNNLRLILSASEPLLSDVPRAWAFVLKHRAHVINMFGQTETAGIVATYPIVPGNENKLKVVPIGRPIEGTRIYLLDSNRQPLTADGLGEICIAGPTVGRGYLNHPELTVEKFIEDPFAENSGARLYRTGDLGRLRPDGTLEFQGRIDNQVKIRGHRVEPAEIEAALLEHPAVREVAVIAREEQPGNSRLVAYVARRQGSALIAEQDQYLRGSALYREYATRLALYAVPMLEDTLGSAIELRRHLEGKLPYYLIPAEFVLVESLPRLPNGKTDRQALKSKRPEQPESKEGAAPRSPVEAALARIWSEVLKRYGIGANDNFFDLGGDSLLAIQAVSRMRKAFQMEIPLRSLFESPTVAALSERIENAAKNETARLLAELEQISEKEAERLLGLEKERASRALLKEHWQSR